MLQSTKCGLLSVSWISLICCTAARADIYQWEYINPADPSQGKQQSATLAAGGAGVDAVPYANFYNRNLTKAYLIGADLTNSTFNSANLTNADLSGGNLTYCYIFDSNFTNASLNNANLMSAIFWDTTFTGATFDGAEIRKAGLEHATTRGFTSAQLYSTGSYQAHDLSGIELRYNDLSGWNFANQNLTGAWFIQAMLTNTDFSGATIRDAYFGQATSKGFTAAQLYSTASYQAGDLSGLSIAGSNLSNWNFAGQKLSRAVFYVAELTGTDFTNAILEDAVLSYTTDKGFTAAQLYSTASYQQGNLNGISMEGNNLNGWSLAGKSLVNCDFSYASLVGTDFSHADVRGALFYTDENNGLTTAQLYSTKSYQTKNLEDAWFLEMDLSGVDFAGQNLSGVDFYNSDLTGADFSGAIINGTGFGLAVYRGFTAEQLYSTGSYQLRDLRGIRFIGDNLSGWNFEGQNLEGATLRANFAGANFRHANLMNGTFEYGSFINADLTGADARGGQTLNTEGAITNNFISADGIIAGLDLTFEHELVVRDHDGYSNEYDNFLPLPVHVEQGVVMNSSSVLELRFDDDEWNSTISFETGISVVLDGTLELGCSDDVNVTSQIGRTLDLFDWTGVSPTGLFTVASDYEWDLANLYTTGEVTLLSVLALPGDFDGDGDVDGRDLLAWQRDHSIGSLAAWQANYGDAVSPLSAFVAVPEPAGVVLAALLFMGGVMRGPRV